MDKLKDITAEEPNFAYSGYTYADYLRWTISEQVELIRGKVFKMSASPRRRHQEISGNLFTRIHNHLSGHPCKVYHAPFDVRLPGVSKDPQKIKTVVQPDICVVCDRSKLDDLGCIGAPDLVVEILSPGNNRKEISLKYEVYEEAGIKEYWIVFPDEQILHIYRLEAGKFRDAGMFTIGDEVNTPVLPGFCLNMEEVFAED